MSKKIIKPLVYTSLTVVSAGAFSVLARKIYDKSKQSNNNNLSNNNLSKKQNDYIKQDKINNLQDSAMLKVDRSNRITI